MSDIEHNNEEPLRTGHQHPIPTWAAPSIGLGIVCIALFIGVMYIQYSSRNANEITPPTAVRQNNEPETPRATADVQILETMSSSDEITAIEADIESTKFDTVDSDMQAIESEIAEFENKLLAP